MKYKILFIIVVFTVLILTVFTWFYDNPYIFLLIWIILVVFTVFSIIYGLGTLFIENPPTISSDVFITLDYSKRNVFYYSSTIRIFQYRKHGYLSKEHKIDNIIEIGLIKDNEIVTSVKANSAMGKAVAGGILFGGWGAIAGSIAGGRTTTEKKKHSYAIEITINDLQDPGVVLDATRDGFFKLISMFKVLEKREEQNWKSINE